MPSAAASDSVRKFASRFGLALVFIALVPALVGLTSRQAYLGMQTNTDDHMVYAAWMRQAAEGHFFFTNRFTTDAQPGLTIHLYFLVLGWISKLLGMAWTITLARAGFSYLFFVLLGRLFERSELSIYASKLAITLIGLGGGIGFLVWHNFGVAVSRAVPEAIAGPMLHRLPTDVWQPETMVFSSMLTNSLFMVSLCLILGTLNAIVRAREDSRAVGIGTLCFGLLMNIHSYDTLILGLVLLGYLVMSLRSKLFTMPWLGRSALIVCGAIPAALWFVYVWRNDPVFQARAATPTYSPNFRQILFGQLPGLVLAVGGLFRVSKVGAGLLAGVLLAGFGFAANHLKDEYWLSGPVFALVALAGVSLCALLASGKPIRDLLVAWMIMGLTAPYFPGLFQRKLAMGIGIPIAALAGIAIAQWIESKSRSSRNLVTILGCVILSGTSMCWLMRELHLQGTNVSSTTVHPVFLSPNEQDIVRYLQSAKGSPVVLAFPGVPNPGSGPDEFGSPVIADLNPILVGVAGCRSVIGHWSETPRYTERRQQVLKEVYLNPDATKRHEALVRLGVDYLVIPDPALFQNAGVQTLPSDGEVVVDGLKFDLIRIVSK